MFYLCNFYRYCIYKVRYVPVLAGFLVRPIDIIRLNRAEVEISENWPRMFCCTWLYTFAFKEFIEFYIYIYIYIQYTINTIGTLGYICLNTQLFKFSETHCQCQHPHNHLLGAFCPECSSCF
jgi:hypothetical protein